MILTLICIRLRERQVPLSVSFVLFCHLAWTFHTEGTDAKETTLLILVLISCSNDLVYLSQYRLVECARKGHWRHAVMLLVDVGCEHLVEFDS